MRWCSDGQHCLSGQDDQPQTPQVRGFLLCTKWVASFFLCYWHKNTAVWKEESPAENMTLPGHQMNDSVNTELDVMRGRSSLIWAMLPWSLPQLITWLTAGGLMLIAALKDMEIVELKEEKNHLLPGPTILIWYLKTQTPHTLSLYQNVSFFQVCIFLKIFNQSNHNDFVATFAISFHFFSQLCQDIEQRDSENARGKDENVVREAKPQWGVRAGRLVDFIEVSVKCSLRNPELLWNCKRHGIFWKSGSCGISSCRKLPRLGWPEADKALQAERDIYWRSTGARACKGKTREFTGGIIQYSDHLPRYVLSVVMEITWDQCLYNKMHFWHSKEVVCLTGHVVSEHDCMVKVPEVRWEFHGFWGCCHDSKLIRDGWTPNVANVNVEARKRTLLGHDWNLAATASVRFHFHVYLCAISHWEKPYKAWSFDEVCMLPFSVCNKTALPSASKVRLVWWLTKISEIARMRHRLPDFKVRVASATEGTQARLLRKDAAMCSFPLTNRKRTLWSSHMNLHCDLDWREWRVQSLFLAAYCFCADLSWSTVVTEFMKYTNFRCIWKQVDHAVGTSTFIFKLVPTLAAGKSQLAWAYTHEFLKRGSAWPAFVVSNNGVERWAAEFLFQLNSDGSLSQAPKTSLPADPLTILGGLFSTFSKKPQG